jgi:hypothetical protein
MSHASDEDLVLLHYREEASAEVRAHVSACPECAVRLRALGSVLDLATPPPVPERGEDYGSRVWERLQPRLAEHTAPMPFRRPARRGWTQAMGGLAIAASLVVAFLLGRQFPGKEQPLPSAVRERVLLVAVGEHLERAQLMLVEIANAPHDRPLDVSAQRAFADELVSSNRLYRQTALRSDEPALAAVLDDLERFLVEVAAGPSDLSASDLRELQRRIESQGLLFRVRVIESHVRERQRESLPPGVTS